MGLGKKPYISRSHHTADLLHGVQVGAKTAVHRENLFINNGRDRQAVEAVRKCLPQFDIVATLALVIESVDAVDRGTFVVSAQDEEVLGVFDLVCQQQADGLERLFATVYVVA